MAALAVQLHGAVLMGHSESGFFPEEAALIDPTGVRGIISIEMACTTSMTSAAARPTMAKVPIPGHVHLAIISGTWKGTLLAQHGRRISIPVRSLWIR